MLFNPFITELTSSYPHFSLGRQYTTGFTYEYLPSDSLAIAVLAVMSKVWETTDDPN